MNMVKRTWAEISLNAIEHNYNVIRIRLQTIQRSVVL